MTVDEKLQELQIVLPEVAPAGNYLPALRLGNIIYVSGQLPKVEGKIAYRGRVGKDLTLEMARKAAKACITNCLAVMKQELGTLDKIKRIVRIAGYVNSYPGFQEQHKVMDAASDLLVEIFGDSGRHARAAIGVVELPLGASVEVEMLAEAK